MKNQASKLEKSIKKEEIKLEKETKEEVKGLARFFRSDTFKIILATIIFLALVGGIVYLTTSYGRIYIEKSEISAPVISLTPASPGILDEVFVKEGDYIPANTIVAQVNGIAIKSKIDGMVIMVQNTPGQTVSSQTPVVQMIDPKELRVVGHIAEDKGLSDIKIGQKVVFTVDTFGSKQYEAVIDSVSPTSRQSGIVFSISNAREEREFDVTARFDVTVDTELKNGMSAKMWVYK